MRSFVRHSVNQDTERYNAWLVRLRHSFYRSDANHRHRINNLKKISHAAAGYEPTAVTWHQRRLICSPQLCPSRNSALPYRVSASYGGRQPPHSAVQPVQVMTTRRHRSQPAHSLAILVRDNHLLNRRLCQRHLFTQCVYSVTTAPVMRLIRPHYLWLPGCALSRQHDSLNP